MLKTNHHAMDELPARCRELESKLDSFIASDGDDADGIDKIPAFATELGNPVIVGLAKAKERLYQITVATTSLGVRLSLAPFATPSGRIEHVAISHRDGPMPIEAARIITDLICQLRPSAGRHQIVCGARGVFHLLIHR